MISGEQVNKFAIFFRIVFIYHDIIIFPTSVCLLVKTQMKTTRARE